jgi:hypothetical protein
MAMFGDFFKQVSGKDLTDEQRNIIENELNDINRNVDQ